LLVALKACVDVGISALLLFADSGVDIDRFVFLFHLLQSFDDLKIHQHLQIQFCLMRMFFQMGHQTINSWGWIVRDLFSHGQQKVALHNSKQKFLPAKAKSCSHPHDFLANLLVQLVPKAMNCFLC